MKRPSICIWLKIYCVVMLLLLLPVVVLSAVMIFSPATLLTGDPVYQRNPQGASAMLAVFGTVFGFLAVVPMFPLFAALVWPRRPSAWNVGIAAIIGGFFTPIGWLATLPLAMFWFRPEVKQYYGVAPPTRSTVVEATVVE